jgi:hypothetical protein
MDRFASITPPRPDWSAPEAASLQHPIVAPAHGRSGRRSSVQPQGAPRRGPRHQWMPKWSVKTRESVGREVSRPTRHPAVLC